MKKDLTRISHQFPTAAVDKPAGRQVHRLATEIGEKCGLIPAIVQDADTLQVLMLGYMNEEALNQTLKTGLVTFFSRSRNRLWVKGETSKNHLNLVKIFRDCDGDALLILAKPQGPTCHRGTDSCFGEKGSLGVNFLARLERIIENRARANSKSSYTARLLKKGIDRVAQKVGEEAVEVVLASKDSKSKRLKEEAADLLYHLLVLLKARNIKLGDVAQVLYRRHSKSA